MHGEDKDVAEKVETIQAAVVVSTSKRSSYYFSYKSTLEALRAYHSIYGNLALPRRYVVPYPNENKNINSINDCFFYPSEWHGVDLSSYVYNMQWWQENVRSHPNRVQELNALGFIWERLQPEWNIVVEALVTYKNLNGNLLIPSSFVVPHPNHRNNRNGFISKNNGSSITTNYRKVSNEKDKINKQEQEDDECSFWPRATWGIPLGRMVRTIRGRQDFIRSKPNRIAQLNAMEFIWDLNEYNFNKCYQAILLYKEKHITNGIPLRIPNTFVIPSGIEHGWPQELWGYPLGAKCCAIRQKGLYVKNDPIKQRTLDEIGFQWSGNASLGWLEVVHAAAIYSQMNGRVLDVPQSFVVPKPPQYHHHYQEQQQQQQSSHPQGYGGSQHSTRTYTSVVGSNDAWPWPEKLWGLKLGQRLKDIRIKGRYLKGKSAEKRRAQLTTLGFVWETKPRGRPPNKSKTKD